MSSTDLTLRVRGLDGKNYLIPARQLDDWRAWELLHESTGRPWTRPNYASIEPETH